jgi:hypothetical protein
MMAIRFASPSNEKGTPKHEKSEFKWWSTWAYKIAGQCRLATRLPLSPRNSQRYSPSLIHRLWLVGGIRPAADQSPRS